MIEIEFSPPFSYVPIPLDADGQGPADEVDAVSITHDVWDANCSTVATCGSEETARKIAELLNRSRETERLREQLDEAEGIIKERDDRLALVDRIADLIGLPHDQELDQAAFESWFSGLSSSTRAERSAVGVKVKPLDWNRTNADGTIHIATALPGEYWAWELAGFGYWSWGSLVGREVHGGLEGAKEAAQRDYESRILSALVLETREAEPVAYRFKVKHEYGWSDWTIVKEVGDLEAYQRDRPQSVLIESLYASPLSLPAPDERLERLVKALEVASDEILSMYRTWVADDYEAMPPKNSLPGKAYYEARAALAMKEAGE